MVSQFLRNESLVGQLYEIIKTANEELVIISPYINLSGRAERALKAAAKGATKVTIISRKETGKSVSKDDAARFDDFVKLGFDVFLVERLHAKLYFNESRGILASVNFNKSSQDNSEEIGILSLSSSMMSEFKAYRDDLIEISEEKWMLEVEEEPQPKAPEDNFGYCIRTGKKIPFNLEKPYTDKSYAIWSRWKDITYEEKFCHFTGESSDGKTCFHTPILRKNWAAAKKKHNL